jgi:WbqC-like protein
MIVTVHQPHFLPWLGYLDRMARTDLFIVLDHVQFERRNYQNRTMIRMNDEARWLTVPVVQRSQKERIVDKLIDNPEDARWWGPIHFRTLRHAYGGAGFFSQYAGELHRIFDTRFERLVDLTQATLQFMRDAFDIRTPLVRSSELGVDGAKSGLILNLCRAVGADTLLAGLGGSRHYLDADEFAQAGVRIVFQEFTHPVYPQCGAAPFIPGLSAIDALFNCGPRARDFLSGQPAPHESRAAA